MKRSKKRAIFFSSTALLLFFLMVAPMFSNKKRSNGSKKLFIEDDVLLLTYNIGDCTFGDSIFSIPKYQAEENLTGIISLLEDGNYDICLFQESDWINLTNYFINPSKRIADHFSEYSYIYGSNSNLFNYMDNGNMNLVQYESQNQCLDVPHRGEGILNDYFLVHKLLIETRIKIRNTDKELIVYNIHLAPYSQNYLVRREQIKYILKLANLEYEFGNYVVIGGDWNIDLQSEWVIKTEMRDIFGDNPWPFEKLNSATHQKFDEYGNKVIQSIDGFLYSPNLKGNVQNLEDFTYSDHSPVELKLKFK